MGLAARLGPEPLQNICGELAPKKRGLRTVWYWKHPKYPGIKHEKWSK